MTTLTPVDLRRVLTRLFDEEELETLCFDLNVDYESKRTRGWLSAAVARLLYPTRPETIPLVATIPATPAP